jgi:hypothetical protein
MKPIPMRADRKAAFHLECRSWARAAAAQALSARNTTRGTATQILRREWGDDERASIILKAAVSPTSLATSGLPLIDRVGEWRSLAPAAAIWQLLSHDLAMKLDLNATNIINVPFISSLSAPPPFVGEGSPAPNLQATFIKTPLGPARKVLVLASVSEELQDASPQNAAQIIGRVLSDAVSRAIDVVAFDANAGSTVRPAGLLYGVTATNPANGTDEWRNTQDDLASLIGAIAAQNIDAGQVVFIANARDAALIAMRSGDLPNDVVTSLALPNGTIIAVAPQALAGGYRDGPTVDITKEGAWQFQDTNPQEIVGTGGAVAAPPVISAFQNYLLAIRVRGNCAWCPAPGSVSFVQSANW